MGEAVHFPPDIAHQIHRVLRLNVKDEVVVLDGSGREMTVRLERVGAEVRGTVVGRACNEREPSTRVTLYQAMIKPPRFEMVLQKGTELGVDTFVPVATRRSIGGEWGEGKGKRFAAIVREAAEQCERGRIPELNGIMPYREALSRAAGNGQVIVLWEGEKAVHLRDVPIESGGQVGVFIGPEGGLTDEEADEARDVGAEVVTLGRRILRAETAAIVGAALVLARAGELG